MALQAHNHSLPQGAGLKQTTFLQQAGRPDGKGKGFTGMIFHYPPISSCQAASAFL
jgi:hypothetical protein